MHHEFTLHDRLLGWGINISIQKKKTWGWKFRCFKIQREISTKSHLLQTSWKILCSCKYWVSNKHLLEHSFFFSDPRNKNHQQSSDALPFGRFLQSFSLEATLLQKEYPGSNAVFWWHMVFFLRRSVAESGEFLLAFPFRSAFNNGLMGKLFVKDTNLKCSKNFGKKNVVMDQIG